MKRLLIPFLALALCPPAFARSYPFTPTNEGFKAYIKQHSDIDVIEARGCRGIDVTAKTHWFQCEVFFRETDPRGTQICSGRFWHSPTDIRKQAFYQEVFKSDCRWVDQ